MARGCSGAGIVPFALPALLVNHGPTLVETLQVRMHTMAVPSCHMLRPAEARSTPRPNACRRQQAWTLEECDLGAASPRHAAAGEPARSHAPCSPSASPIGAVSPRRVDHGRRLRGAASTVRELTVMFTDIAGFTRARREPAADAGGASAAQPLPPAGPVHRERGRPDRQGHGRRADRGLGTGPARRAALHSGLARGGRDPGGSRGRQPGAGCDAANRRSALRVGIHAGPLIATPLGAAGCLGMVLCGDTVNVAQRLEDAARDVSSGRAVTIVASDAVVARAGRGFRFDELGELPVRGRREPVLAFEVIEPRRGRLRRRVGPEATG